MPCVNQNGDITGYSVQYGVQGKEGVENAMIAGSDNLTITLNRLEPETTYLVQVAGVNAQGVGDYCNLTVSTPQSEFDAATNTHKCICKHLPTCTQQICTATFTENSYHFLHSCISRLWWHESAKKLIHDNQSTGQ